MDYAKIAKFIVNGYRANKDLFNKLLFGGITLTVCKLMKIPVSLRSDGISIEDSLHTKSKEFEDIIDELPWSNSPKITAIHHILDGAKRKSFDSDRMKSAKMIFEIADEAIEDDIKSYAIKSLSQIARLMDFGSNRSSIDNYIKSLVEDIV